jgi:uncharacterized protein YdiU (UPF0061 family)
MPDLGWTFDTSYVSLPDSLYHQASPEPVKAPELVLLNESLADELGLNLADQSDESLVQLFSGNSIPEGATPLSQAYAGHQFGHFTNLGDGRAHLLGEHLTPEGRRVDIQFKGSGQTIYARRGDGRAALGPMLREFIMSEAMHQLGVPTTRSLAVVVTGEPVMRETVLPGAILTRVASSHIRVGTFEYLAAQRDVEGLKALADYTIQRHYPEVADEENPYLSFLKAVMQRQLNLVIHWLRIGFIHGVMNTDNMSIAGETIDYGPCAFLDEYHPEKTFSSIDHAGRYAFANQPQITQWNLARLAEAILPLLDDDQSVAMQLAEKTIDSFREPFKAGWLSMMRQKLGLLSAEQEDKALIGDFLQWMQGQHADYSKSFYDLTKAELPQEARYHEPSFQSWYDKWQARLDRNEGSREEARSLMARVNPVRIPRNHQVEAALMAAEEEGDFQPVKRLLEAIREPYTEKEEFADYETPPTSSQRVMQTFCGT